jgi:hypothetical protein
VEYQFRPGQSGNPGGRPKYKAVSAAYRRLLEMPVEELANFKPRNGAEVLAIALFKAAAGKRASTYAAIEITNRVEGKARFEAAEEPLDLSPERVKELLESAARILERKRLAEAGSGAGADSGYPGPAESQR